jgi:hypothetical protein
MGKMNYALEKGQKPRLEISWKGLGWKNVTIKLDGMEIGKIPSKHELMDGWEFLLDKNTTLKVQLAKRFNSWELQVLVNGQPVPGSASDPNRRLAIAYGMVFFVTGVNIIAGIIAELLKIDFLLNNGLGIYSVIFGVIMGIMGVLVWTRHSSLALGIAVGLLIIDGIMGLIAGSFTGLVLRIFILIPMFGGFSAIRELKERKQIEIAV